MNIEETSNLFLLIAEGEFRKGTEMEDIARDLALALKTVIIEGLDDDPETVIQEFKYLCGFIDSTDHRHLDEKEKK